MIHCNCSLHSTHTNIFGFQYQSLIRYQLMIQKFHYFETLGGRVEANFEFRQCSVTALNMTFLAPTGAQSCPEITTSKCARVYQLQITDSQCAKSNLLQSFPEITASKALYGFWL